MASQDAADAGPSVSETAHGTEPRGLLATPRSSLIAGRFGRLFRELPPFVAKPESMIVLGAAMVQAITNNQLDEELGTADRRGAIAEGLHRAGRRRHDARALSDRRLRRKPRQDRARDARPDIGRDG